jgi:hypothetical protein
MIRFTLERSKDGKFNREINNEEIGETEIGETERKGYGRQHRLMSTTMTPTTPTTMYRRIELN